MAKEMEVMGKNNKAFRLYKHAIALAPKHPEVLTKYGEYLEHRQNDIVKADQYYVQVSKVLTHPKKITYYNLIYLIGFVIESITYRCFDKQRTNCCYC